MVGWFVLGFAGAAAAQLFASSKKRKRDVTDLKAATQQAAPGECHSSDGVPTPYRWLLGLLMQPLRRRRSLTPLLQLSRTSPQMSPRQQVR